MVLFIMKSAQFNVLYYCLKCFSFALYFITLEADAEKLTFGQLTTSYFGLTLG